MSRSATLLALLLALTVPASVSGQEPETDRGPDPQSLVISEKSPGTAAVLEWLVPTAGYGYAGDWSRGIPSAVARVAGVAMIFGQQFTIGGDPPPCEGTCVAGAILAVSGTLWGVLDAAATARRTNDQREEALSRVSISPVRGSEGTGVRIGMRLSLGR